MKKSFYKRMLLAVSVTLMAAFALSSFYYITRIRQELEKRTISDLEFTSAQFCNTMNSKLKSIVNISNWIITNGELNEKLNYSYTEPYEYWKFYDYMGEFCDSLIQLEDSIRLITVFSPNETLKADNKNVRSIDEIRSRAIYDAVTERDGSPLFCMMREAVDASYFLYNTVSNANNICMMRMVDYKGTRSILMIEIKAQLFLNEFCRDEGKGMYVEDGNGQTVIYYENGKNLWKEGISENITEELKSDHIYLTGALDNQWNISLFVDRSVVFADVYRNIRNLILTSLLLAAGVLLANTLVIRRTSVQLLRLNDVITKAYLIGESNVQGQKPVRKDEVGQVIDSFEHLMQRVEYLMNEVYRKEIQNKSMELELLHSQIKPHFLYNTLSSIASLARRYHDEKLMNMITSLSDLYRISLSRGRDVITVEKEIEMTKSYLYIMENRFEDLIHVDFKVQKDTLNGLVPKILLQPFVENSINHAIRPDAVLNIIIDIRRMGDTLVFQIYDDGLGMEEAQVQELLHGMPDDAGDDHGYGIPNVHRRIRMYMGEDYGVEILSKKAIGTNVKITMPYWETFR